ncbi:TraR/DksA C4-type zinc finger protein [Paenibacillus antibioticophila]|uniref:TraR/DksA C4-type zinc finger protein n=1 Tax=Paenibacillus antibioticophila TaxID=1274374 RepID=UPI0005CB7D58|nr:TraR/DksA C4-type zinc finger protein [Paenibacillus antibioticophila]
MTHLSDSQLRTLEHALLEEQRELEHHFDSSGEDSLTDSTGELSAYDNHPADAGTELFERSRDLALADNLKQRMSEIGEALGRIRKGTYGNCVVCGQTIPYERLTVMPYTEFCTEHAQKEAEVQGLISRIVEEDLITPPPARPDEIGWQHSGRFDDAGAWRTVERFGNSDSPAMAARRNAGNYESMLPDEEDPS